MKSLNPYQKRQFLPDEVDFSDVEAVKNFHHLLINRALHSLEELEQWILDRSELESALDQAGSILYIQMTCQTDDAVRSKAYKDFLEHIIPAIKPLENQMDKKLLKENQRFPLDEKRYAVYLRAMKTDEELFADKNVPLQTQVDLLSQEYQTVCGAMTVEFDGRTRTLPEMSKFLLETDRDLRERAWRATAQRRLQDKDKLDDIFNQMLTLRRQIAHNTRSANFALYKFRSLHRFDYTPEDCKNYHQTVERLIVPLWKEILEKRQKKMGVTSLRPWDTAVDPLGRAALSPFQKVDQLVAGCQSIFDHVDPVLGAQFAQMAEGQFLDLASRQGKAPGGYQSTLNETRRPFIFMNAVGVDDDVWTLLHEAGHAFHALACREDSLIDYRQGPMEFNEVASMGMELLGSEYLSMIYPNKEDELRSKQEHWESIVFVLAWVAVVDAFQFWIYENPDHTPDERRDKWIELHRRFGGDVINWQGLDEERHFLWHRQLHIFEVPFYYIEYGIAQLGALQIWLNSQKDKTAALAAYRQGLSLGGSVPLPEIFKTAGIPFDFSEQTIAPVIKAVKGELEKL